MKEDIERGLASIWTLNAKLQECTSEYQCGEVTRTHGKEQYHRINQQTHKINKGTSVLYFESTGIKYLVGS